MYRLRSALWGSRSVGMSRAASPWRPSGPRSPAPSWTTSAGKLVAPVAERGGQAGEEPGPPLPPPRATSFVQPPPEAPPAVGWWLGGASASPSPGVGRTRWTRDVSALSDADLRAPRAVGWRLETTLTTKVGRFARLARLLADMGVGCLHGRAMVATIRTAYLHANTQEKVAGMFL